MKATRQPPTVPVPSRDGPPDDVPGGADAGFVFPAHWPVPGRDTLRDALERRAQDDPGQVLCVWDGGSITVGEVDRLANRFANALLAQGVVPGDVVALMMAQHVTHVAAIYGLAKLGVARVPVNMESRGAALALLLGDARPKILVAERGCGEVLAPVLASGVVGGVLWNDAAGNVPASGDEASSGRAAPDRAGAGERRLSWLMAAAAESPPPVRVTPDSVLSISYTSGTTGIPKKFSRTDCALQVGALGTLLAGEVEAGDVMLLWEPLYHGAGANVVLAACMERVTLAMTGHFSASRFWEQARRFGATKIHYIGGILPILLKQPPDARDTEHRVRIAWGGGCPVEVWREFEQRFGVRINEGYGLTEIANFICINRGGPVGSIGRALPFFEIRIVDDERRELPPDTIGQIIARPRRRGYASTPLDDRTVVLDGGWIQTGDLGRMDAQGWLTFAGRRTDSLRRRGVNISAWEVERVVVEHPAVEECALVGVPSGLGDDDLKLFVRLAPAATLEPLALVQWCETRMPYFQVPRYIRFIDAFPKTPTQRIRKAELSRATDDGWDLARSGYALRRRLK